MLKVRRFVIVFLVSIMCLLIAPFHVYAYSISQSNIRGVNFDVVDIIPTGNTETDNNSNTYFQVDIIFKHEVVFDTAYLGYVTGTLSGSYYAYTSSGQYQSMTTTLPSKSYYINGYSFTAYSTAQVYLQQNMISQFSAISRYGSTFTLAGSNVYDINYTGRMLEDIEDILYNAENIYTSVYDAQNGTIIEQVVTTNDILNDVSDILNQISGELDDVYNFMKDYKYYQFPFESYSYLLETSQYLTINTSYQIFNYIYPLFTVNYYDNIVNNFRIPVDDVVDLVFLHISNTPNTTYVYNNNFSLIYDKYLMNNQLSNNKYLIIKHLQIKNISNASQMLNVSTYNEGYFIPIYCNLISRRHISDDFAQKFDLIDKMYQEALEDSTSHMQDEFNDMFDYEDDFNNDMNTALQNINVNFDVGNQLGSKFLASADWVRQQYNTLTSNTPFGTVLSFSLLLGLALLIIGKAVR